MNRIVTGRTAIIKLFAIGLVVTLFTVLSLVGTREKAAASAFGPSPTFTNAPGESNCTVCHADYTLNEGDGFVDIIGVPSNYTPGQPVTITVRTEQASAVIYGFQLTAIDSTGQKVGVFSVPVQSEKRVQILQGVVGENLLREYAEHTSAGLTNGQFGFNSWDFTWTAPMQPAGRVDFYATANAANSDGGTGGDYIYSDTTFSVPATAPVSIGGRVTTPSGLALRNAKVILTSPNGGQTFATTSSFGIYSFAGVPSEAEYTISVQSKRYRFAPRILTPTGNLTDIDFVGLE